MLPPPPPLQKTSNQEEAVENAIFSIFDEVFLCEVPLSGAYFQILGQVIYWLQLNESLKKFNSYKKQKQIFALHL